MRKIIVMLGICFYSYSSAQSVRYPVNIYWLSAGQYGGGFTGPASFAANPAAYPEGKGLSCGLYAENRFMIEGLSTVAFSALITGQHATTGISGLYFGNPDYHEVQAGISYGRSLGKINIGASIGYHSVGVAGAARQSAITYAVSSILKVSDDVFTSIQLINPGNSTQKELRLASIYRFGLAYRHSSKVYTALELLKEEDKPPEVIAIVYYRMGKGFFSRLGFISGSSQLSYGAGWSWKNFSVEVVSSQHAALGYSPAVLFTYQKKEQE